MSYLTLTLTLLIIIRFKNEFGFENKYSSLDQVCSLYNLTLTRGASPPDPRTFPVLPNPGDKPPRPPVRSLYYLTLTLTLKIKIRLEHEFGFAKMYLVPNQVRFLYYLTLTPNPNPGGKPPDPPYVP